MSRLPGITALVTDVDTEIGRTLSLALAREGADVRLMHHISDAAQLDRIIHDLDRFEVLITNTALEWRRGLDETADITALERAFRMNIEAAFVFSEAMAARMKEGGTIILTAPMRQAQPTVEPARAIAAAAQGITTLTASLAERLSCRGIRVNTVVPGEHASPAALAPIYIFLASSAESGLITGMTLGATGGPPPALPTMK
jgi:NAD(P)-dependent dehydrogenase (short-subunit alcohol dehydrogenase family)